MGLLHFRYHNTNCFAARSRIREEYLAIDAGWPGTLREYQRNLKALGVDFKRIRYCFATHFHMDHAGLVGDFLNAGLRCFVFENQLDEYIDMMERTIAKGRGEYAGIRKEVLERVSAEEFNGFLREQGFGGEVLVTPGHSPDSISYITPDGEAAIGDLCPLDQIMDDPVSLASWEALRAKGARRIFPSHADFFEIQA
jgi:glyoxylase-like metal-dependent hydrolase (beta-lactamase superfamily II)